MRERRERHEKREKLEKEAEREKLAAISWARLLWLLDVASSCALIASASAVASGKLVGGSVSSVSRSFSIPASFSRRPMRSLPETGFSSAAAKTRKARPVRLGKFTCFRS